MCPSDLSPYADAYFIEKKSTDAEIWSWCGNYVLSAVLVAVEHVLEGEKASSSYINEPLMKDASQEITQDELQKEREALVMRLRTMKVNWDISHKK